MSESSAAATEPPAPASIPEPAADASRQEIQRIRASEAFQNDRHPEHAATAERLSAVYRQVYGGQAQPSSEGEPLSEEAAAIRAAEGETHAWPFERPALPAGQEWDVLAEHALRAFSESHGVPAAELTAAAAEYRHAWDRRTMDTEARLEARDAALEAAWGEHVDLKFSRAVALAQELSPRLLQHVSEAGMFQDAWIWLRLVEQLGAEAPMSDYIQQFPRVALDRSNALLPSLRQELDRLQAAGVIRRYWVEHGDLLVEAPQNAS